MAKDSTDVLKKAIDYLNDKGSYALRVVNGGSDG
jgi:hypothetical protein